jgi:hypothetical protein
MLSQFRFGLDQCTEFFLNESYLPVKEPEKLLFAFERFTVRFERDIESVALILNFCGSSFQGVIFPAKIT